MNKIGTVEQKSQSKNRGRGNRPPLPYTGVFRRYVLPVGTARQLKQFAKQRGTDQSVIVSLAIESYMGNYTQPTN